ncbi:MAG: ferrochelatase [Gammaproteobacteria bacterium]|jgi:ferrochelatase|nr:ferrochelatase [Gammaproteobacteria bacterium]
MNKTKIGVLLINLGTPDNPDTKAVRRYLREFLSDPRVIDLPWIVRKVLLHLFILPFRPRKSAAAYRAIWDKQKGSPLLFHSVALKEALQATLGASYQVEIGMRYGNPHINAGVDKLLQAKCQEIIALPLFPQYSSAASGSAIQALLKSYAVKWNMAALSIKDQFYKNDGYIAAKAEIIKPFLPQNEKSHVVFSYHSLPVRQIQKSSQECAKTCFENKPCSQIGTNNYFCYRAQCFETSRLIAQHLGLLENQYTVAFQSRLGRTVWIGPDIQSVLFELRQQKTENVVIACPSFVADCLETIEEIGMRAKEQWLALGGHEFTLVPCLNAHPLWVKALAKIITQSA